MRVTDIQTPRRQVEGVECDGLFVRMPSLAETVEISQRMVELHETATAGPFLAWIFDGWVRDAADEKIEGADAEGCIGLQGPVIDAILQTLLPGLAERAHRDPK